MPSLLQKPKSIFKAFLDIVLPPVCYVCGRNCSSKYGLCTLCLNRIRLCAEYSKNPYIEKAWSCSYYKDTIKECIHLFKYRGYIGLIDIFRDIMIDFVKKHDIHKNMDLIVPVPVYPTKKRERTYNHAEILARSLSKNLVIPIDVKNLKKIKWTQSQSELGREKRLKNVKDSFLVVDKGVFSGKCVLVVDDVYTTGATINECAKVLRGAKASKVFSLTLARGA
ncbi:MAG: ComF family protein [Candidatus Omnitrophota bacterium]|nr:MAG: ComF family protein [Candidatus Omnitrophota bacterium]